DARGIGALRRPQRRGGGPGRGIARGERLLGRLLHQVAGRWRLPRQAAVRGRGARARPVPGDKAPDPGEQGKGQQFFQGHGRISAASESVKRGVQTPGRREGKRRRTENCRWCATLCMSIISTRVLVSQLDLLPLSTRLGALSWCWKALNCFVS